MKIYTKLGDEGTTSLVGGKRVPKNHPRVEAYGNVDELISHIGLLRAELSSEFDSVLRRIQSDLMLGAAHLASLENGTKMNSFPEEKISFLENEIDILYKLLPPQKAFILPSSPREASLCHIARCVCRRAERSSLFIEDRNDNQNRVIKYLNRLSDYLFTLGRFQCVKCNISEDFWLL